MINNLPAVQETWIWSLGQEDPLEKGMATHSSILAWRIPWTEEPGGLQSMKSQRVGHNWATNTQESCRKTEKENTALVFKEKEMDNESYKPERHFSFQNILRQMTLVSQWAIISPSLKDSTAVNTYINLQMQLDFRNLTTSWSKKSVLGKTNCVDYNKVENYK